MALGGWYILWALSRGTVLGGIFWSYLVHPFLQAHFLQLLYSFLYNLPEQLRHFSLCWEEADFPRF